LRSTDGYLGFSKFKKWNLEPALMIDSTVCKKKRKARRKEKNQACRRPKSTFESWRQYVVESLWRTVTVTVTLRLRLSSLVGDVDVSLSLHQFLALENTGHSNQDGEKGEGCLHDRSLSEEMATRRLVNLNENEKVRILFEGLMTIVAGQGRVGRP
jgi:hypothetical protein